VKVIQPNCRAQFTASDLDFIVSVFVSESGPSDCLVKLLSDPDSLDSILDHDQIFKALLDRPACLQVSPHFYFYVLVRHVLKRSGIEDRSVADYVAAMLAEFSSAQRARPALPGCDQPTDYIFEMLSALQKVDDTKQFLIRAHIGNHSLFVSGIFPEHIRYRAQFRGAPELEYYENMGRMNYRVASDHRLAQQYELSPVFEVLSESFHPIRLALNDMSERIVSLGDRDYSLETLLRQNLIS
jgi:hypothetical protein